MIVLDASAAIEWVLNTAVGGLVGERIGEGRVNLNAPHLVDLEVAQVLRRLERTRLVSAARVQLALEDFAALDLNRYPHDILLPRVWELRGNLSAYDASYVALAEALGATLLTADSRLAASPGHRAQVVVVSLD